MSLLHDVDAVHTLLLAVHNFSNTVWERSTGRVHALHALLQGLKGLFICILYIF